MHRSRKGSPPSNVVPFRIPARTEDPGLPPANGGVVVRFRRLKPDTKKRSAWFDALELFEAELAAKGRY